MCAMCGKSCIGYSIGGGCCSVSKF
jgi:hypothetical protein